VARLIGCAPGTTGGTKSGGLVTNLLADGFQIKPPLIAQIEPHVLTGVVKTERSAREGSDSRQSIAGHKAT
jgi:hypothetical protein